MLCALDPANHRKGYDRIKAHYERVLGVEIDASGSDAGRLCFVSYDSALYISPRFEAWLNGSGELPGDIPVLSPVPPDKPLMSVSRLFARARRRTTSKYKYADGSRNNYVHLFAWHCNRLGVPKEETEGYCRSNFGDLPEEELRQAVASAYSHVEEQGIGKTTWFRRLAPALSAYVFSGNVDPSSKDALFLLSDCFLILLDELSGQSRMELNRLKAMITKDVVRERRAYARNAEVYVRRASFAATVNDSQVLTDRTGSRRFLCFEAQAIDYSTPVDHAGVYAQALALYRGGFKFWFFDTDITDLNVNNEAFQQSSPEEELFYTYFRHPERFDVPLFLSSSEIMAKISLYARLSVTGTNVNNIGKLLTRDDFEYKIRKGRRLFAVVELTFEQVKARQMGISGDDAGEGREMDKDVYLSDKQDDTDVDDPDLFHQH